MISRGRQLFKEPTHLSKRAGLSRVGVSHRVNLIAHLISPMDRIVQENYYEWRPEKSNYSCPRQKYLVKGHLQTAALMWVRSHELSMNSTWTQHELNMNSFLWLTWASGFHQVPWSDTVKWRQTLLVRPGHCCMQAARKNRHHRGITSKQRSLN